MPTRFQAACECATRGQQVPTLPYRGNVLRKTEEGGLQATCTRAGTNNAGFLVGWAFMPTRFRLPLNAQRVGNECPPYLNRRSISAKNGRRSKGSLKNRNRVSGCLSDVRLCRQKQFVRRVVRMLFKRITQVLQERFKRGCIARRHVHTHQHAPVIRAVVAVVEQRDVPVGLQAV